MMAYVTIDTPPSVATRHSSCIHLFRRNTLIYSGDIQPFMYVCLVHVFIL